MSIIQRLALVATLTLSAAQAGLVIDATYDASVTAQEQAGFNYAIQEYENAFTNNIHVNIDFTTMSTGLGESSTPFYTGFTYSQVKAYLVAKGGPGSSSLGATDPTGGGNFALTTAQAKAFGYIADNTTPGSDGTVSINNTVTYTYGPATIGAPGTSRSVAGAYDFIGVAEHEIAEVMGRVAGLDQTTFPYYTAYDLFRYTAANTHNVSSTATGVYFSINGGTTNLAGFNSTPGEDLGDFNGNVATDPYNAATGTGQGHSLSSTDFTIMNSIGYTQSSTPEPSSVIMFLSAGLLIGLARLRA